MTVTVERISDPVRWREVRDEWDGVVLSTSRPSIYATWDFLDASWTHFAAPVGDRLSAFMVRDGGRAIGVAGYRQARRRPPVVGLRRLCVLGGWESDRPAPAFESGRESECAAALLGDLEKRGAEWDVLDWREAPIEHPFTSALRAWAGHSAARQLSERERSPSAVVELPGTWDEYLAQRSRNERSNLRRQLKRLDGHGPWEHEIRESAEDMPQAFQEYLAIEARSWKPAQGQGIGRSPRTIAFYRDLLVRCARRGLATVHLLKLGDEHVAGEITLRLGGCAWGQQWTYDERHTDLAPGSVLKGLILRREIEQGTTRYELLALFAENKKRWTRVFQPNIRLGVRQTGGLRRRLFAAGAMTREAAYARGEEAESPSHDPRDEVTR
jgi:CelD/BcsL family acetyltransferase involved in cellulose biosynthesis